jgi:Zinc carboxypeptidase/Immune inhibitor A-like, MAM domain
MALSLGMIRSLLVCILGILVFAPALATAADTDIPLDRNGLPMWEIARYDGFPIELRLETAEELDELLSSVTLNQFSREDIQIVFDTPKSFYFKLHSRVTDAEATALTSAGYEFERVADIEQQVRRESEALWAAQAAKGGDDLRLGKRAVYHTHAQIGSILAQTALDHPTLADDFSIGNSVQGRELWAIKISDNVNTHETEPEVRLSSTMHGNEPPGLELLLFLVDYLTDNYGQIGFEDVTYLVDNFEIYILPLHNPDGNAMGQRANASGIDLNRNFPVPDGTIGDDGTWTEEVETELFKNWGFNHSFVISKNGHSGATVVNYPWDFTYTLAPDDAAIQLLSLEFSTYNLPMYNGNWYQGITNGAQWYRTWGCLQDWSYNETDCIDVTIEYHDMKTPPASYLDGLWDDNRESFMHWIKAASYGVNGLVTGSDTGLPLNATITVVGNEMPVHSDRQNGDYYKLLHTGTFDLIFEASGYITQTVYGVSTTWGTPTVLDVALDPVAYGNVSGTVQTGGGEGLSAWVEIRTYPGDTFVNSILSDGGNGGAYSTDLVYGEYKLIATHEGYVDSEQLIIIGATPVTANFVMIESQETTLFVDDFENGDTQWSGEWGIIADGFESDNSYTDSPDGNYVSYAEVPTLMANSIDLSEATEGMVSFWAKWNIEENWDAVFFEVTLDDGASFDWIATEHTDPGSGQGEQPAGAPVFEGNQASWVLNTVDLAPWLGESNVRFGFRLMTDTSQVGDGFYFDDFEITVISPNSQAIDDVQVTARNIKLSAARNPFRPQTALNFATPAAGAVRLMLFDAEGHLTRVLVNRSLPAGQHSIAWDGKTGFGIDAPHGVYFARLESGKQTRTTKLMLVR